MKKLICYVLILAMGVMLFAGCGNFDIENEDLSAYVKLGDIVTVETSYGTYRYQVIDIYVFHYQDDSALFETHTDKTNLLLMYTCYPRKNSYAFKEQRLAVIAEMIEGKDWSVNAGE